MTSEELSRLQDRVAQLERENERLWRTNQQLARERLGIADSAAAAALERSRAGGQGDVAAPSSAARFFGRIRRGLVLALPHGVVLMRMRMRSARNPDEI
jgi:hypothetical protein